MSDNLRDFLIRVASDDELTGLFDRLADVLDYSGLSPEEQAAFLSRDSDRIRQMLGDEDREFINMIFHWFKPGEGE